MLRPLWELCGYNLQILEAEGMLVPDELSCILQLVSDHLKEPCPITNLSGTQGPAQHEGLAHPTENGRKASGRRQAHQVNRRRAVHCWEWNSSLLNRHQGSSARQDSGSECCLSLCQAVSFLPAAEEDEEIMVRKEDGSGRGTGIHLTTNDLCSCWYKHLFREYSLSLCQASRVQAGRKPWQCWPCQTLNALSASGLSGCLLKAQPTQQKLDAAATTAVIIVPVFSLSTEGCFLSQ